MKKRIVAFLAAAALITGSFAGCGSSSSGSSTAGSSSSADAGNSTTSVSADDTGSGAVPSDASASGTVSAGEAATAASETDSAALPKNADAKTIVCATTTGYYPYVYTDDNDNLIGYDIELIKAVFDRLPQYNLEFELNDWDSILTGLDSGIYQISTETIFYSEDRAEKYYFSDPISYDPVVAVTPADYKDVKTFDDIQGETTPASAGSIWAIAVEKYNETTDNPIKIDYTAGDYFQLFQQVEAGDYILLTDYGMAAGIMNQNNFNVRVQLMDADWLSQYISSSYTYFMMSRFGDDAAQLRDDVNGALREVVADGTATKISEKYFDDDFSTAAYPVKDDPAAAANSGTSSAAESGSSSENGAASS